MIVEKIVADCATVRTETLTGSALDWAVAKAEGYRDDEISDQWNYSSNWEQGGHIIEREWINITNKDSMWIADIADAVFDGYTSATAKTPLEAAMRCYVLHWLKSPIIGVPVRYVRRDHE